jgi:preprotein translocase subunit SecD
VLRDNVALWNSDITNPREGTSQSGGPDVTFGFTAAGAKAFRLATAAIARRGQAVSRLGQTLDQHFAFALDNQLLTVPSIDFKVYPDGIVGTGTTADIVGGFTAQSAKDIATELRYGPLPLQLRALR